MAFTGIFDSGLGGLTILKALQEQFPNEEFVYLADNKNLPYGNKSCSQIQDFALKNARFLTSLGECKGLIIACNTASISAHSLLTKLHKIPIIEMVDPTIKELFEETGMPTKVGILATSFTTSSEAYKQKIQKRSPGTKVHQIASPHLVPLIEAGDEKQLQSCLVQYFSMFRDNIEVVILGCTHYSLIKSLIQQLYPRITLIDSPKAVIKEFNHNIAISSNSFPRTTFFCTEHNTLWQTLSDNILGISCSWNVTKI
ncbi:glutamate racemase [Brevinema andersonii]|uniref:Glutamate racemase n=1 Tax=Brevinema andersonii TaxID=34097 RepID=A0A1I1DKS4_BREAD|nr:glutamate racemase [Brevinema andersonii]SFB74972.1 glutamate racemase [Brevinema andersonii]